MQKRFKSISLLVIVDNSGDFILLDEYLRDRFDEVLITRASTFKQAANLLQAENSFQAILLDLSLPDKHGEQLVIEVVAL
jgi:response regulator of citrate/malate metabolism